MIRVYKYGLLPPIDHAETVQDQMRAGHRYRNTLTEIERGRRAALREIDRSIPEVAAQEALVSERLASLTEATSAVNDPPMWVLVQARRPCKVEAHRLAHKLRDPKFYTARTKRAVNSGGVS